MKKIWIFIMLFFVFSNYLQSENLYYGFCMQTQNGTWEEFFNSPQSFLIENNYITYINPKGFPIVYITPLNYVIILNYGEELSEPIPISNGNPFNISFQEEYFSDGNLVLTAQFDYSGFYYEDHIVGNLELNVVAVDPFYISYQGLFHFNFDAGIHIEGNSKYIGYYKQLNNGDWEGFINAPFNITIDNNNIIWWNELNKDIVYITTESNILKLPFGSQFMPPVSILDGIPFHIEFTDEYEVNGEIVLTENITIDGTKNGNYISGTMAMTITALNPDYNDFSGNYSWEFEAGIENNIVCENDINPENQLVSSNGGTFGFEIITESECFWEISTDVPWISNFSNTSNYGSYSGTYSVLPNLSGNTRTGNIILKNKNGEIQKILKIEQSNLDCPKPIGYYSIIGYPLDIKISGNYAYISSYEGGLRIFDISNPNSPYEVGFYNDFQYLFHLEISGNYAYIAALDDGLLILDISNPAQPFLAGQYFNYDSICEIALSGNYAYLGNCNGKLEIVEVSNPQSPQKLGQTFLPNMIKDISISGNYAYIACLDDGLRILDISNPTSPFQISFYNTPNYALSLFIKNNYCYLIDGDLRIIDISNPYFPEEVYIYKSVINLDSINISGIFAYILNDNSELIILDLSNPSLPKEIGYYPLQGCLVWASISGNFCFIADSNGGMQTFDISCIVNCQENLGDVNENGSITSLDVSFVLQYIVGSQELNDTQKCKADVNINNSITSLDAFYLLKCAIGSCNELPTEFYISCQNHNNCI